jgi:hypothetical protein
MISSTCPRCGTSVPGVFPIQCPNCDFSIDSLAGRGTSDFQKQKWLEHTDILQGRNIGPYGKELNASFDFRGHAKLDDLVRFTITFGDTRVITSPRGSHATKMAVAYFPEVIGSGTSLHFPGRVACSGLALMSPQSLDYAHSFPILDLWVQKEFGHLSSNCRLCGRPTPFGQPLCEKCHSERGMDWESMLTIS